MATASRVAARQAKAVEQNSNDFADIKKQLNRIDKKLDTLLAAMSAGEAEEKTATPKKGK